MGPIRKKVHINVDLGEGYGNFKCGPDDELIPLIDHANVACGFHAGDPLIMQQTVRACKERGIVVGAHPGLHRKLMLVQTQKGLGSYESSGSGVVGAVEVEGPSMELLREVVGDCGL